MEIGPLQPSGRVIAGGRLLLACLFFGAVWVDASQPARGIMPVTGLLIAYLAWSLGVTLLVWNDWWRDARLAAPAHVIDVAVFMIMLYSTEGYASPHFTFFIFILLAAAIRWGWKETAITAAAIIAVYFSAGMFLGDSRRFESEDFIVRTGHLFIISAILIWFGANQWLTWPRLWTTNNFDPFRGDPFAAALQAGMAAIGARTGALYWREPGQDDSRFVRVSGKDASLSEGAGIGDLPALPAGLLFDLNRNRVLMRADASRWRFLRASETLRAPFGKMVDGPVGLAVPFAAGMSKGLAVFQDIPTLSTDHLDIAPRLASDIANRLQEAALFAAVEERSMAKARVAVARDLHDSVVQFLAGIGFRLEALIRSPADADEHASGLAELKDMVLTEQRQMRAFIRGLKAGKPISVDELSRDCASLCQLLGRQWNIDCAFSNDMEPGWVMLRAQLEVQQLIREAVANAVRHGGATQVSVSLAGDDDRLGLTVADNGCGFATPAAGLAITPPDSLSARVREARGEIEITSRPGGTAIVIQLPVGFAA